MRGRRKEGNAFHFLLPRALFVLLMRTESSFNAATQARLSLKPRPKNELFSLVTLRLLSKLPITLIASLFYFLHVSVVCFNVSCIKAFNKRQCLTIGTNLVHCFS